MNMLRDKIKNKISCRKGDAMKPYGLVIYNMLRNDNKKTLV